MDLDNAVDNALITCTITLETQIEFEMDAQKYARTRYQSSEISLAIFV